MCLFLFYLSNLDNDLLRPFFILRCLLLDNGLTTPPTPPPYPTPPSTLYFQALPRNTIDFPSACLAKTTAESISDSFFKNNNGVLQFYKSTDITEKLVELDFSFQQMAPMGYTKRLLFENHWGDEPILIKHKNEWTSETQRYTAETANCYRLSTPCSEVPKKRHG